MKGGYGYLFFDGGNSFQYQIYLFIYFYQYIFSDSEGPPTPLLLVVKKWPPNYRHLTSKAPTKSHSFSLSSPSLFLSTW